MNQSRVTVVTESDGTRHEIPDVWLMGRQTGARARGEDGSIEAAIGAWLLQARLARMEEDRMSTVQEVWDDIRAGRYGEGM